MKKRSAIGLAALAVAVMATKAYADPEPTVTPVVQQQGPAIGVVIETPAPPPPAPVMDASAEPPASAAPERANGCNARRPERQGLALVLVPFDFGRQALRSLRGIFVSC